VKLGRYLQQKSLNIAETHQKEAKQNSLK